MGKLTEKDIRNKFFNLIKEDYDYYEGNIDICKNYNFEKDLLFDELDIIEFTMEVEELFDVEILDEDSKMLNTTDSYISLLALRLGEYGRYEGKKYYTSKKPFTVKVLEFIEGLL